MKYITRIDNIKSRKHGYSVRFGWKNNKPTVVKFFGDIGAGGKNAALTAAKNYRDTYEGYRKNGERTKPPEERYRIQKEVGRKVVVTGTGFAAAEIAKEHGAGRVTVSKIRNHRQDRFVCNHRPPLSGYEVYGFTEEITKEDEVEVRSMIKGIRPAWCDLFISESVSAVLLCMATGPVQNKKNLVLKIIKQKDCTIEQRCKTESLDWCKDSYGYEPTYT